LEYYTFQLLYGNNKANHACSLFIIIHKTCTEYEYGHSFPTSKVKRSIKRFKWLDLFFIIRAPESMNICIAQLKSDTYFWFTEILTCPKKSMLYLSFLCKPLRFWEQLWTRRKEMTVTFERNDSLKMNSCSTFFVAIIIISLCAHVPYVVCSICVV